MNATNSNLKTVFIQIQCALLKVLLLKSDAFMSYFTITFKLY